MPVNKDNRPKASLWLVFRYLKYIKSKYHTKSKSYFKKPSLKSEKDYEIKVVAKNGCNDGNIL